MDSNNHREIIDALAKAGAKGLSAAELVKRLGLTASKISSALRQLKATGLIRGPFQFGKSKAYFDAPHAPSREAVEAKIEAVLRPAGLKVTTRSQLDKRVTGNPKALYKDALHLLKSDGRIIELKGAGKSVLYIHRDPIAEHLRIPPANPSPSAPAPAPVLSPAKSVTLDDLRPVYGALKAQQGGISAVTIYDILVRLGCSRADLHRLLLSEARQGRLTLHPATTVNFPPQVIEAGVTVEGQAHPFVTVVIKEGA